MNPLVMNIRELLNEKVLLAMRACGLPEDLPALIAPGKKAGFGDYQANCAMGAAKVMGSNPRELAARIVEQLQLAEIANKIEIAGPGFINIDLNPAWLGQQIAEAQVHARMGITRAAAPQTIVIDYSGPNLAKEMHVGHLRSTIIGDALVRLLEFQGHNVIRQNHVGDWGTQFGMILWGWKNVLDQSALEADPIEELLRVYREVNARIAEDETLRDTCKAELVGLQGGDPENLAIWERCIEVSKIGLQKIYDRLDIRFDHWYGESFYNDRLAPLVADLLAGGIAEESEGAICVFFRDDEKLADKPALIRKSDGGFLYATTDLATVDFRIEELGAEAIWYVVGAPQQLHFDQIFAVSAKRGQETDLHFIPFGSILGKDRKMLRTRSGETVQLADVLAEAVDRAMRIVEEKNPELPAAEKAAIAEVIGIGAVKYAELSQFRMTDYIFDWDTMLSLKGNTAPYLINAYVRTRAIFRKLGSDFEAGGEIVLTDEAEKALLLKLAQFAEIVPTILDDFRPNALAAYLYEVATTYHQFWEACPVLKAEGEIRQTRLALCELTGRVLHRGLGLLGIRTTEKM